VATATLSSGTVVAYRNVITAGDILVTGSGLLLMAALVFSVVQRAGQ
jgi:hypothetical protein